MLCGHERWHHEDERGADLVWIVMAAGARNSERIVAQCSLLRVVSQIRMHVLCVISYWQACKRVCPPCVLKLNIPLHLQIKNEIMQKSVAH